LWRVYPDGVSVYGSSLKGTWREGSLAGGHRGQVEKALEMDISLHRGPAEKPGRGLIYQRL